MAEVFLISKFKKIPIFLNGIFWDPGKKRLKSQNFKQFL